MPNFTLHMSFINTPYTEETIARPMTAAKAESARKRKRFFKKTKTAELVAGILEDRYGITNYFAESHKDDIEKVIRDRADKISENIAVSKSSHAKLERLMKPAAADIEKMFRTFLDKEEMNGNVPGVPTKAAIMGIRRGRGRKGSSRPSFIDTGIYRASFRTAIDVK